MADGLPPFLNFKRRRLADGEVTKLPGATTPTSEAVGRMRAAPAVADVAEPDVVEPVAPLEAPAAAGPVVTPEERRPMGLAPLPVNARGETVGKPVFDDTGDRATDLENYKQGLGNQRNPEDRDGRWWTMLKEAGRGFLEGGLKRAAARGIRGAVAPNVNERRERDQEMARVEGEQGKVRESQAWSAKLSEALADTDLKRANAEYTRRRPEIESDRNDLRADIAREGFETRKSIATMQDGTKRHEGAANRTLRKSIADQLADFRKTALYERLKDSEKNRASREGIAARAQAGADRRAAAAQEGANSRTAATQAGADRRALAGKRFSLMKLALQADKEGTSLEELVNEVETKGGEILVDDEK